MSWQSIKQALTPWASPAVVVAVLLYLHGDTGDRIDRVENRIDRVGSRIDRVENRLAGLDQRMDSFDQRMAHLEGLFEGYISRPVAATDDSAGQPVQ